MRVNCRLPKVVGGERLVGANFSLAGSVIVVVVGSAHEPFCRRDVSVSVPSRHYFNHTPVGGALARSNTQVKKNGERDEEVVHERRVRVLAVERDATPAGPRRRRTSGNVLLPTHGLPP